MTTKQVLLAFLCLVYVVVTPICAHAKTASIDVSAESAILYSPDIKEALFKKNAPHRMPMASTTKVMTALAVLDACKNLESVFTIPKEACGIEGSSLYLVEGETLTIKELLEALLLRSANDAAVALAIAIDQNIEKFCDRMNRMAEEMGLLDTHFSNPHGLDAAEHYTTAYDLARITEKAMEHPVFRSIVASKKAKISGPDNAVRIVANHNKLLWLYDDAIGVKTGFTKKSGRCLVGAADRDGVLLITVTLNAPNDWQDHQNMFEYGFSQLTSPLFAKSGELSFEAPVVGGAQSTILLTNQDAMKGTIKTHGEAPTFKIEYNRPITAPVKQGEVMGKVYVLQSSHVVAESPLVAKTAVSSIKTRKKWLWQKKSDCKSFYPMPAFYPEEPLKQKSQKAQLPSTDM